MSSDGERLLVRVARVNCNLGLGNEDRGALAVKQVRPGFWRVGFRSDYDVLTDHLSPDPVPTRVALAWVRGVLLGWRFAQIHAGKRPAA